MPMPRPWDIIVRIETDINKLKIQRKDLCDVAGVKPEMYSYMKRRAKLGYPLPEDCLRRIKEAIVKLKLRKAGV